MTPEWSVVIASHIDDDDEGGASISELNSVGGCDLIAAVGGAGQTHRDAAQLQYLCGAGIYLHNGLLWKYQKKRTTQKKQNKNANDKRIQYTESLHCDVI